VSGVASQSCYDKSLHWEDIKTNFWSGANITWENLKGVWRLGSANTLSRPSYKSLVCNHVLNTIQYIIRDTYIYIKPMYSIKFYIILETHTYTRSILFNPNPNLNLRNLRKENPNPNPRNPKKTLSVALKNGGWFFSNCNWEIRQEKFTSVENLGLWISWWGKVIGSS